MAEVLAKSDQIAPRLIGAQYPEHISTGTIFLEQSSRFFGSRSDRGKSSRRRKGCRLLAFDTRRDRFEGRALFRLAAFGSGIDDRGLAAAVLADQEMRIGIGFAQLRGVVLRVAARGDIQFVLQSENARRTDRWPRRSTIQQQQAFQAHCAFLSDPFFQRIPQALA